MRMNRLGARRAIPRLSGILALGAMFATLAAVGVPFANGDQQACVSNYTSAGFPKVYSGSPLNCNGCPRMEDLCPSLLPGAGVTLCYDAMPCTDMGGGTPAPCPCNATDGGGDANVGDASDGSDAGMCTGGEPPYPPPNNPPPIRTTVSFDLPEPMASFACTQLSAIPYAGPLLFSGSGVGFSAEVQESSTDEWRATCHHETSKTSGGAISVNMCGLEAKGSFSKTNGTAEDQCLNCGPPPSCGDLTCSTAKEKIERQAELSRSFDIPLGGNKDPCCEVACSPAGAPKKKWVDWILGNVNLSANVGGGWNGTSTKEAARGGESPSCGGACADCDTNTDKNTIFLQVGADASMSTPSWGGVSGSASVSIKGRASVSNEETTSTCGPSCGGMSAAASVSMRMSISAGAFGYSVGQSVGYTCRWAKSWSTCKSGPNEDTSSCGWSEPTEP